MYRRIRGAGGCPKVRDAVKSLLPQLPPEKVIP
jgi:hypothetical protein